MTLHEKICKLIKVKREARGYSQEGLAKLVYGEKGTRSQISQIENQYRKSTDINTLDKIFSALNIEVVFRDLEK